VAALAAPLAQADMLTYSYSNSGAYSGTVPGVPVDPSTVYATAVINWTPGTNTATITMHVSNDLQVGAYVNDWYFNLDPTNAFTNVVYSGGGTQAASGGLYWTVPNGYNADGGGYFDLRISFDTANPGQLGRDKTSIYTVTTEDVLTATSFNYFSVRKNGQIDSRTIQGAVHVQGYQNSVWLEACVSGTQCSPPPQCEPGDPNCGPPPQGTPEPATLAILGTGLLGMAIARRRRKSS